MTQLIILISIVLGGIAIDQITKAIVVSQMEIGESVAVIPEFLHITSWRNTGIAFGWLGDSDAGRVVYMIVSTLAIIAIGVYLFGFCKERMLLKVGLSMIVSGGIGNMIDRIFRPDGVVDMIDFCGIWDYIFNVADSLVCVGAGIVILALILDIIKSSKKKKDEGENKEAENTSNESPKQEEIAPQAIEDSPTSEEKTDASN